MKKALIFIIIVATGLTVGYLWRFKDGKQEKTNNQPIIDSRENEIQKKLSVSLEGAEVVVEDLKIPWEIVFLPDGDILVTERQGKIKKIGQSALDISVPSVEHIGEGGLLGMALHPNFQENKWLYLYYTTNAENGIKNIVERYVFFGDELIESAIIIDNIPAGSNHNGGRIAFGPDGFLYIATGDSGDSLLSQNIDSLAGKILRVKEDGSIPDNNPFNNAVYSYGHRNVQGIAWDEKNQLWATEHGRSGVFSGYDELNLIEKGANYGWPEIQGNETRTNMKTPVINSGATTTWAPSGAAYYNGSIFFTGLRGQTLYEYKIEENKLEEHLKNEFGRIRNVKFGPEGSLYFITNNTDGRGAPRNGDDKIIKINQVANG